MSVVPEDCGTFLDLQVPVMNILSRAKKIVFEKIGDRGYRGQVLCVILRNTIEYYTQIRTKSRNK